MTVILNPYIAFQGNAREALAFYHSIFGGELNVTTFGDMPGMETDPADKDLLMHGMLVGDNGLVLMAADMRESEPYNGSISLSGDDKATLTGYYDKLAEGGTIGEPLTEAPWGDTFGMVTDKFGIYWMVNISATPAG